MGYLQSKFLHPLGEKKRAQKHPLNPFVYKVFGLFREINFTDSGISNNDKGKARYSLYDEAVDVGISKPSASVKQEKTPEELINDVYLDHMESMREQLMNAILNSSPAFFEELVVQLLIKMGYGYDMSSGKVTRYCKDGGIDGIIEEDRLGLDKIYIQAKRYSIT